MRQRHHDIFAQVFEAALGKLVDDFALAQTRANGRQQFRRVERLGQEIVRAKLHTLPHIDPLGARSKENERDGGGARVFAQFFEHAVTVHFRHHDVADNEVGDVLDSALNTNHAIFSANCLKAFKAKHLEDIFTERWSVFDDKYLLHESISFTARFGRTTMKTVPLPSWLVNETSPPCSSTACLTMASPRPVPEM